MSMSERVALVTGASRGIGRAIATELAQSGARVVGTATTEQGASAITEHFTQLDLPVVGKILDNRSEEDILKLFAFIQSEYGSPTIVVNNAGITKDNLMLRMSEQQWSDVIDVNLNAVFRITKAALRGMIKAGFGRVITIGSVVGHMGNAGQVNYSASKAAVAGFSRSLAQELGSRNVTVNVVAPGFITTDMTDKLSEEQKEALVSVVPLKRMGTVHDIAKAVAFLASEHAGYITGETLHVNGGMYMQ